MDPSDPKLMTTEDLAAIRAKVPSRYQSSRLRAPRRLEVIDDTPMFMCIAIDEVVALLATVEALRAALSEIAEGSGRFSEDRLEHAINVIEKSKAIAREALAGTWRPEA